MDQSTLQAFAVLAETYSEKPRVVGLDLVVSAKKRTVLAHLKKFSDLAETFRVVRYICWE